MLTDQEIRRRLSMKDKAKNYFQLRRGAFEEKHHGVLRGERFRVFFFLGAIANVKGPLRGVAETSQRQTARILGNSANTTTRCFEALAAGGYIGRVKGGWRIMKFGGESSAEPAPKMGANGPEEPPPKWGQTAPKIDTPPPPEWGQSAPKMGAPSGVNSRAERALAAGIRENMEKGSTAPEVLAGVDDQVKVLEEQGVKGERIRNAVASRQRYAESERQRALCRSKGHRFEGGRCACGAEERFFNQGGGHAR